MSDLKDDVEKTDPVFNPPKEKDDTIITLMDVLEQENEMEKEYAAVLGGSDEKFCTYSKGYIKRQALYACLTCTPDARNDSTKRAGVCLACSYNCHEGHEMVELYTKRNFRCDCGTAKILAVKCQLDPLKVDQNDQNMYNQNFSGLYCSCHRPYPDPEDPIDDQMIQCIVCEDWYHCRHLAAKVPTLSSFTETICGDCIGKYEFLQNYASLSITMDEEQQNVSVGSVKDESMADTSTITTTTVADEGTPIIEQKEEEKADEHLTDEINQCIMDIIEINKSNGDSNEEDNTTVEPPAKKQKLSTDNVADAENIPHINNAKESKKTDEQAKDCCRKPVAPETKVVGATFWPHDWRLNLCTCAKCVEMLTNFKLDYLLDQNDTVLCYEEKGMNKVRETDYDRGMRALSKMQHGKQIDVIMGYNRMKEKLVEFLNAFVTSQQVVTEDDINRFFRMMKEKNDGNAANDGGGGGAGAV